MGEAPQRRSSVPFDVGGGEQDRLFELLSHPYRRFVVGHLRSVDDPQSVGEVAADLGAWQAELPPADRSADGVAGIETELHHTHLPKLAAADVVEYDPARGTVTPTPRTSGLGARLDEAGSE